jgi:hypothetical protein
MCGENDRLANETFCRKCAEDYVIPFIKSPKKVLKDLTPAEKKVRIATIRAKM